MACCFTSGSQRRRSRGLAVRWGLVLSLVSTLATPVFSHDLWIVPGSFYLQPGEKTRVFINSGDVFPRSDARIQVARIESLTFHSGSSEPLSITDFVADAQSLTAELSVPASGTGTLALALEPRLVRLLAEEFHKYLADEDLPRMITLREALGESAKPVVERYTKWAKALVTVGDTLDRSRPEAIGLRLEIVPLVAPGLLSAGEELSVVVLFQGEPLPDVPIVGGRAGTPPHRVKALTDSSGRATVSLAESGRWYLRALHMIRLEDDPEAEWESFWSTLTFEVPR